MPRKKKSTKDSDNDSDTDFDSDDQRDIDDSDSDQDEEDYFHDEVDDFNEDQDKILLGKKEKGSDDEEWDSESDEEVLGLDISDEDDDDEIANYKKQLRRLKLNKKKSDMGSDLEDEGEEKEIKTFGTKRSHYYGADVGDDEIDISGSEDEEGAAALEEKEALALQKKMEQELDEQDFGLDVFKKAAPVEDSKEEKITKDLTKLSKREKLQLLQKESPELLTLIEDFKMKMTEVKETLLPLLKIVREGKIQGKAAVYVETKCKLNLNYCTNISFYMMLKAKQIPVHNHPVIKRLVQYRNLMKQLEPVDDQARDEMLEVVEKLKRGEEVNFREEIPETKTFVKRKSLKTRKERTEQKKKLSELMSDSEEETVTKKQKRDGAMYETKGEKEALEYYEMMKGGKKDTEDMESDEEVEDGEEKTEETEDYDEEKEDDEAKRALTYQIAKNKGFTPKRKKEQRNPRVKHRMKFRKANIRRKGQIREVRTEMTRYGGEASGIRTSIKRGIKMKV